MHRTVSDFISECLQCKIHKRVNQRTHAVTQTKSMCCICVIAHGDQCNLTLCWLIITSVNESRFKKIHKLRLLAEDRQLP